ncbi:hypothetical protein pb186bvf_003396 [Paramecium bursaria]
MNVDYFQKILKTSFYFILLLQVLSHLIFQQYVLFIFKIHEYQYRNVSPLNGLIKSNQYRNGEISQN